MTPSPLNGSYLNIIGMVMARSIRKCCGQDCFEKEHSLQRQHRPNSLMICRTYWVQKDPNLDEQWQGEVTEIMPLKLAVTNSRSEDPTKVQLLPIGAPDPSMYILRDVSLGLGSKISHHTCPQALSSTPVNQKLRSGCALPVHSLRRLWIHRVSKLYELMSYRNGRQHSVQVLLSCGSRSSYIR